MLVMIGQRLQRRLLISLVFCTEGLGQHNIVEYKGSIVLLLPRTATTWRGTQESHTKPTVELPAIGLPASSSCLHITRGICSTGGAASYCFQSGQKVKKGALPVVFEGESASYSTMPMNWLIY